MLSLLHQNLMAVLAQRLVRRVCKNCRTPFEPTEQQLEDLLFAWKVAKFVKSNAIVFCKDGMTMGVGAGQMSRLDSARIASIKAGHANLTLQGTAVASDAFFPFRDGLDVVVDAGATCVIQPGGSMRDQEVIDAADERGVVMVLCGASILGSHSRGALLAISTMLALLWWRGKNKLPTAIVMVLGGVVFLLAGADPVAAIANHLDKFWEPRMRTKFFEIVDAGGTGLRPLVLEAAAKIRRPVAA